MNNWTHIMIHHSLTRDSATLSWDAIRDYHVNTNRWRDVGYHFGIEKVNTNYECLVGMPLNEKGIHCKGMNSKAIGICCVGNYDLIEPENKMLTLLAYRVIRPLMYIYSIPIENIVFHNEYSSKTCPGRMFDKQVLINLILKRELWNLKK